MSLYRIRLLPAHHGDCILIEYGDAARPHRVLIDGGPPGSWTHLKPVLEAIPEPQRRFDLLVVSHVDADHIGGVLALFEANIEGLSFEDIWFNGYQHLRDTEEFGPVQGERLTAHLWRQSMWNRAFGGRAVVVPTTGALPTKQLPGGMRLTLLSPTRDKLLALLPEWERACARAGLSPREALQEEPAPVGLEVMGPLDIEALAREPFVEDRAPANGSSIAFLAEYANRAVLFGADAHPSVLEQSVRRLEGARLQVDAFKLPHHGSRKNLSPALLERLETSRYLISTNGSHSQQHPDRQTLARILVRRRPCGFWFNYRSGTTETWDEGVLRDTWAYTTIYPENKDSGIVIDL